jgi:hypothetical protein
MTTTIVRYAVHIIRPNGSRRVAEPCLRRSEARHSCRTYNRLNRLIPEERRTRAVILRTTYAPVPSGEGGAQ